MFSELLISLSVEFTLELLMLFMEGKASYVDDCDLSV